MLWRTLGTGSGPLRVILNQRLSLAVIHRQTLSDRLLPVVVALNKRLTGNIVLAFHLGRIEHQVIGAPRAGMDTTTAHAPDDFLVADIDLEHEIQFDALRTQSLGLWKGARKSVEEKTFGTIGLPQALGDKAEDVERCWTAWSDAPAWPLPAAARAAIDAHLQRLRKMPGSIIRLG